MFLGKTKSPNMAQKGLPIFSSILFEIFEMRYYANQRAIVCHSYEPKKLMYQFTQTRWTVLVLHLLGLGFWIFIIFHCFLIINRPWSLIVT